MSEILILNYFLGLLLPSIPVIGVLLVGLRVCWTQRRRRPRVARLLAAVMGFQLIWILGLLPLVWVVQAWLNDPVVSEIFTSDKRLWDFLVLGLPPSCEAAVVWGLAFGAVWFIDDFRQDEPSVPNGSQV